MFYHFISSVKPFLMLFLHLFRKVDGALTDLTKNFAEGTEYFKVTPISSTFICYSFHSHLLLVVTYTPSFVCNMQECAFIMGSR